jgi:hypothetical protein
MRTRLRLDGQRVATSSNLDTVQRHCAICVKKFLTELSKPQYCRWLPFDQVQQGNKSSALLKILLFLNLTTALLREI